MLTISFPPELAARLDALAVPFVLPWPAKETLVLFAIVAVITNVVASVLLLIVLRRSLSVEHEAQVVDRSLFQVPELEPFTGRACHARRRPGRWLHAPRVGAPF